MNYHLMTSLICGAWPPVFKCDFHMQDATTIFNDGVLVSSSSDVVQALRTRFLSPEGKNLQLLFYVALFLMKPQVEFR